MSAAKSAPRTRAHLYLRCNDMRGKFSGFVTQVQAPGLFLLSAPSGAPAAEMSVRGSDDIRLEIAGVFVQATGYRRTAQFPLWDAATVSETGLLSVCNHLRRLGWTALEGNADLVAKFNRRQEPLTAADLAAARRRAVTP